MAQFDVSMSLRQVSIKAEGKIYVEDAATLREQLQELMEHGHSRFTIDMEKVSYIDSSGLGVLVAAHKKALEMGGGIVLKGVQGAVKELFRLTRLNKIFNML